MPTGRAVGTAAAGGAVAEAAEAAALTAAAAGVAEAAAAAAVTHRDHWDCWDCRVLEAGPNYAAERKGLKFKLVLSSSHLSYDNIFIYKPT